MKFFKTKKTQREHLLNLTKELIRFPSHIDEPLKIFDLVEFIKNYFAKDPVHINEYAIGGLPSLVISTEDTKHPHILLSGHIDVVPSSSLYTSKVEGNKLYGSGSMDMKGGVACMMATMKYFASKKEMPSLGLMITSDEEIGGESTRLLLAEEGYNTDFCIVNEGRPKYEIVTREKGIFVISVSLKSKPIHSAYPWRGKNVLEDLMKLCQNVKAQFPRPRDGWIPTVSTTFLRVGKGEEINTIPGEAEAIMFFRLTGTRKWNKEKILTMIKEMASAAEVKELIEGSIFKMDENNSYIQLLRQVAKDITGRRISFGTNHGASDGRHFVARDIPTAILGPVGKDHHCLSEYVSINSLNFHFEVLKKFVEKEWKMGDKGVKELTK
jgi:succinyl-diaminopimelate desuccinylase